MITKGDELLRWCHEQRAQACAALDLYDAGQLCRWGSGALIGKHEMSHLRQIVRSIDQLIEAAENS